MPESLVPPEVMSAIRVAVEESLAEVVWLWVGGWRTRAKDGRWVYNPEQLGAVSEFARYPKERTNA